MSAQRFEHNRAMANALYAALQAYGSEQEAREAYVRAAAPGEHFSIATARHMGSAILDATDHRDDAFMALADLLYDVIHPESDAHGVEGSINPPTLSRARA